MVQARFRALYPEAPSTEGTIENKDTTKRANPVSIVFGQIGIEYQVAGEMGERGSLLSG